MSCFRVKRRCVYIVDAKLPRRNNLKYYLIFRRFKTEQVDGRCFDSLEIFNGSSVASSSLSGLLCGEIAGEHVYISDTRFVTFRFLSDESAQDRGFSYYVVAHTNRELTQVNKPKDKLTPFLFSFVLLIDFCNLWK